jgi:predicted nucleic acid-binding protein
MKPRIYVETSVISYLAARPSRNAVTSFRQELTKRWWEKSQSVFGLEASDLVLAEVSAGDAQAAKRRLEVFKQLTVMPLHPDIGEFVKRLIAEGLVPMSEPEDASHIAQATLTGADYIATWNFAHMVGPQTKYRLVQNIERWGYKAPLLATPEEILEGVLL